MCVTVCVRTYVCVWGREYSLSTSFSPIFSASVVWRWGEWHSVPGRAFSWPAEVSLIVSAGSLSLPTLFLVHNQKRRTGWTSHLKKKIIIPPLFSRKSSFATGFQFACGGIVSSPFWLRSRDCKLGKFSLYFLDCLSSETLEPFGFIFPPPDKETCPTCYMLKPPVSRVILFFF